MSLPDYFARPVGLQSRALGQLVNFNGRVHLYGGWSGMTLFNDAWVTIDGAQWVRAVEKSAWLPRAYFPVVEHGGALYLAGGFSFDILPGKVHGDVFRSYDGFHWHLLTSDPGWQAREHSGLVSLGGSLYLWGGVTYEPPAHPHHSFPDVWKSVDGITWDLVTDAAPFGRRRGFGYGVLNGRIFMWGGIDDDAGAYFNDVWSSVDGEAWELVTEDAGWAPRITFGHAVHDGRLWVLGGTDYLDRGNSDVWSSPDGITWTKHADSAPFGEVRGPMVAPCDGGLLLVGGIHEGGGNRTFLGSAYWSADGATWHQRAANLFDSLAAGAA